MHPLFGDKIIKIDWDHFNVSGKQQEEDYVFHHCIHPPTKNKINETGTIVTVATGLKRHRENEVFPHFNVLCRGGSRTAMRTTPSTQESCPPFRKTTPVGNPSSGARVMPTIP